MSKCWNPDCEDCVRESLMQRCDRCYELDETVEMFDECFECGPVPLCFRCRTLHLIEMAEQTDEGLWR